MVLLYQEVGIILLKYNKIKNSIAKQTGNLEWFRNNNQTGNYKENDKLKIRNNLLYH